MFCSTCGAELKKDFKFCQKCGQEKIVPLEANDSSFKNNEKIEFFIVPTLRLIVFSILSFGFYSVYWFALNFNAIEKRRKSRKQKTHTNLWAFFNMLTSEILFKELSLIKKESTGKGFKISPAILGVFYFVFMVLGSYILLSPFVFIFTALTFQKKVKEYEVYGLSNYKKAKFSWKEVLVVFISLFIFIGAAIVYTAEDVDYSLDDQNYQEELSLLAQLNPYMEPVGYFSRPELFDVDDIDINEWLSYISYYDIEISDTPLNELNLQFSNQREVFSSVVKVVCENEEFFSEGSGVNFESAGYVLTNKHVIEDMTSCVVGFPNPVSGIVEEAYWATPIVDEENITGHDLAYLSIETPVFDEDNNIYGYYDKYTDALLPYFNIKEDCFNGPVQLGDSLFVIGYPYLSGGALTITNGLISSLYSSDGYLITSAKINSGNSGGLAVDKNGCYIGVPTAVYYEDGSEYFGEIIDAEFVYEFNEAVKDDLDLYLEKMNEN